LAVVGSAQDVGRLYVLVLGSGGLQRVRTIARQFITEFLGPTDLMAVVHASNRAATQGLTGDRELLLAAVDRYRGGGSPEASFAMLKEVAVNLKASTGRRKAVLFIDKGFELWSRLCTGPRCGDEVDAGVLALKRTRLFEEVTRTARANNVRIYPIDPGGWTGASGQSDFVASLRIMAADTGGISSANTNNYRGNFPRIVRDNSAYYLVTYSSTADADGAWCAYEHMCPHQATPLGGIPLMRGVLLRCPEHGSMFDVTTGKCVMPSDDGWTGQLRTYRTQVVDDVVQVSLR
jgi:3-phenylpropionate/trans-cinnamate dioxygenase ferredoxin subunit